MTQRKRTRFTPVRGYTRRDWDAVSNNPEVTDEQVAKGKSFGEAFPDLMESIKRSRGRPRLEDAKEAVTLRLDPKTLARFKSTGKNWRARMAKALDRAKA